MLDEGVDEGEVMREVIRDSGRFLEEALVQDGLAKGAEGGGRRRGPAAQPAELASLDERVAAVGGARGERGNLLA